MTDFQKEFFFDDGDYQRSCKDKKGYDSEWHAQYAVDECFDKSRVKLSFYRCRYCGKWHLTSVNY